MMMDEKTLLQFIYRILKTGSQAKALYSLEQLERILSEQRAPKEMILLVEHAKDSIPEARESISGGRITAEALEIAHRRAKERIAREYAARSYGRC